METETDTLVRMSKATVERLDKMKVHPRQSREEVVVGLIDFKEKKKA